jgi:DNA-directed RNA polymerase specialized sigma24 family protein
MDQRKINKKQFTDLIEKNRGIIHKITLMYTNTSADKEDLYQEICLQLWRSVGNDNPGLHFKIIDNYYWIRFLLPGCVTHL